MTLRIRSVRLILKQVLFSFFLLRLAVFSVFCFMVDWVREVKVLILSLSDFAMVKHPYLIQLKVGSLNFHLIWICLQSTLFYYTLCWSVLVLSFVTITFVVQKIDCLCFFCRQRTRKKKQISTNASLKMAVSSKRKDRQPLITKNSLKKRVTITEKTSERRIYRILTHFEPMFTFISILLSKMKSNCIRGISGPCFKVFGPNTEIYSANLCIQSAYEKIRTRINSYYGNFARTTKNLVSVQWVVMESITINGTSIRNRFRFADY